QQADGGNPAPAAQTQTIAAEAEDKDVFTYVDPWVLGLGVALPLLLLLMKLKPAPPRTVYYSPARLISKAKDKEESPTQIPWWMRQLRLTAAAFALVAMAQPLWNPDEPLGGEGPVVLVVDNDWASADNWQARIE